MSARRVPATLAAALAALLMLAGCSDPDPEPTWQEPPSTDAPDPTPTPTAEPAPETLPWGPTVEDLQAATEVAEQMSDDVLAGQVIVARYAGDDPQTAADLVADLDLAGVILFTENVTSTDQVRATAQAVQQVQSDAERDWPAVISVDNEGGPVQRMSAETGEWTSFPPFAAAGAVTDAGVVRSAYEAMAGELRGSGVTMDFAPVADVSIGAQDPTINVRAAGSEPAAVSAAVVAAVQGFADGGVISSIKHFPGHGSLTVDSHIDLPVQAADDSQLASTDLVPFVQGIDAGAPTVMMGHIAVRAWDPDVPASLSPEAYRVLREDLDFTGVAITDGLDMGALVNRYGTGEIAVNALAAGADLLLTPGDARAAHEAVLSALEDGSLDRARVQEAAGRVIALQRWQEHLSEQAGPAPDDGSAASAAQALSAAAITQVTGSCGADLLGDRVHLRGGSRADWEAFSAALTQAGAQVVPLEQAAETEIRLVGPGLAATGGDVAISFDGPWLLEAADAPVLIAAHGRTAASMTATAAVLTGQEPAPGRLGFPLANGKVSAC